MSQMIYTAGNSLMTPLDFDFSKLTPEARTAIMSQLQTLQMQDLKTELAAYLNRLEGVEKLAAEQFKLAEQNSKRIEIALERDSMAVRKCSSVDQTNSNAEYVGIRAVGRTYLPEIRNNFAKLLIWAEMAYFSFDEGQTIPKDDYIRNKTAVQKIFTDQFGVDRINYKWHIVKTKEHIDKKLQAKDLYMTFHSHTTKAERDKFINSLRTK